MRLQGCGDILVRSSRRAARAFTLVEILFAVMVLGIALLGLGAFFPVVVRQQQVAQDATLGVLASQSAEAQLKGRTYNGATLEAYLSAWARTQTTFIPDDGSWVTPIDPVTGALYFGVDPLLSPTVALADRLYPADASGAPAPQFVWDLAVRRITPRPIAGGAPVNIPGSDRVQAAMFVRRVDPRLALPRGGRVTSLFQCLQDASLDETDRRWPVSVSLTAAAGGVGEPTLDGRVGQAYGYSMPVQVDVQFPAAGGGGVQSLDRLAVRGVRTAEYSNMTNRRAFQLLAQPGQQFVDNLGNVYTVLGADPDPAAANNLVLRFTPPVSESVPASDPDNPSSLNSILMTPQAPAAILVFTVKP